MHVSLKELQEISKGKYLKMVVEDEMLFLILDLEMINNLTEFLNKKNKCNKTKEEYFGDLEFSTRLLVVWYLKNNIVKYIIL